VILDYDAGNLRSVQRAVEHVGVEPAVSADPDDLYRADAVIMPGVGAAGDTMAKLSERRLVEPVRDVIAAGKPFLGVCMGLQALFEHSDEGGDEGQQCLGVLPGRVRHFIGEGLKVPHMGWNQVAWQRDHPVSEGIPDASYFYFVHSFHVEPEDRDLIVGETDYGVRFASVVARDNVIATQFHPEKSGPRGLQVYANFLKWARVAPHA
jgi:glutamine amidotransferase